METRHYLTCLWPGLSELWWRGRLSGLPAALAFACALNTALIARFLYPGWLPTALVSMAWWIGIPAWAFFVVRNVRELPALLYPRQVTEAPDRFPEARDAYLKGDWTRAGQLLTTVLAIEPRDPPALLLLAGVYRQRGQLEAAERLLQEIARVEVAEGWSLEWRAESRRLERAKKLSAQKHPGEGTPSSTDEGQEENPVSAKDQASESDSDYDEAREKKSFQSNDPDDEARPQRAAA